MQFLENSPHGNSVFYAPWTLLCRVDTSTVRRLYVIWGCWTRSGELSFPTPLVLHRNFSLSPSLCCLGETEWFKAWWVWEDDLARVVPFSLFGLWDLPTWKESALMDQVGKLSGKDPELASYFGWVGENICSVLGVQNQEGHRCHMFSKIPLLVSFIHFNGFRIQAGKTGGFFHCSLKLQYYLPHSHFPLFVTSHTRENYHFTDILFYLAVAPNRNLFLWFSKVWDIVTQVDFIFPKRPKYTHMGCTHHIHLTLEDSTRISVVMQITRQRSTI